MILIVKFALASKNFLSERDPAKIANILTNIPAGKNSLDLVLRAYGLKAVSILFSEPDQTDIDNGSFLVLREDRFIDIVLSGPLPHVQECRTLSTNFIQIAPRTIHARDGDSKFLNPRPVRSAYGTSFLRTLGMHGRLLSRPALPILGPRCVA